MIKNKRNFLRLLKEKKRPIQLAVLERNKAL